MRITLIAALAANRCIGKDNDLPWRLPSDLAHFKRKTLGHVMIMGRKTFESFGSRPLPGRPHVVVSKSGVTVDPKHRDQVYVVSSPEDAVDCASQFGKRAFVIGGATLFTHFLSIADDMILSEIEQEFEGDTFFPEWDRKGWYLTAEEMPADPEPIPYTVRYYQRRG
jgi:dihydrofolate reductase